MSPQIGADSGHPDSGIAGLPDPRRGFIKQCLAIMVGGLVGLVPIAVGVATFLNPLRKSVKAKQRPSGSDADGYYKVASLDALSNVPQAFKIVADGKDAWNTYPREAIGAVFLQQIAGGKVRAFNVTCPHAGCAVDYRAKQQEYHCPCHNSSFAADGVRDPESPSARDLDALDVKIVDGDVLVKFQNFATGSEEKKPL